MRATLLTIDFGRIAKIFVTKCVAGQYYYAQQDENSGVKWERQVHQKEVKPFFICSTEMAKIISKTIDNEFHSDNGARKIN